MRRDSASWVSRRKGEQLTEVIPHEGISAADQPARKAACAAASRAIGTRYGEQLT